MIKIKATLFTSLFLFALTINGLFIVSDIETKVYSGDINQNPKMLKTELIGQLPEEGEAVDVVVQDDLAYLADSYAGLEIYNVSNTKLPLVGTFRNATDARSVFVSNQIVYLADYDGGLWILDCSDPANIKPMGFYPCQAVDVVVEGAYVYVVDYEAGLLILDDSNPENIGQVGSYQSIEEHYSIAVRNNVAFLTGNDLWILNITEKTNPRVLSSFDPGDYSQVEDVFVENDLVYIIDYGTDRLYILDIADVASPTVVASPSIFGRDIFVRNNLIFVGSVYGLEIYELTAEHTILYLGEFYGEHTVIQPYGIYITDDVAYLAAVNEGLILVDVVDPENPSFIAQIGDGDLALDVCVSEDGNLAYVANFRNGLKIIQVSDPNNPKKISQFDDGYGFGRTTACKGNYVYLADEYDGIDIIDVTNPPVPELKSEYVNDTNALDIVIEGNYAYIASSSGDMMQIVDISNPLKPQKVGSFHIFDCLCGADSISIEDSIVGLASYEGLFIVDVSNPQIPELLSTIPINAKRVIIKNSYAYVIVKKQGLHIFDLTDPTNPKNVGTILSGSTPSDLHINGSLVYVARKNITIIDTLNKTNPTIVGEFAAENSWGLFVKGSYIYSASRRDGLQIIKVSKNNTRSDSPTSTNKIPGFMFFPFGMVVLCLLVLKRKMLKI